MEVVEDQHEITLQLVVERLRQGRGKSARRADSSLAESGPLDPIIPAAISPGRSGIRRRSAANRPRAKLGRLRSSRVTVYQAGVMLLSHSPKRVDFPKPASAMTVVSLRLVTSSRRLTRRGRSRTGAPPAGGIIFAVATRGSGARLSIQPRFSS